MGAFIELQSGEEILLDLSDIPEPPQHLFVNNPYLKDDVRFKRWRSAAKARYTKSCYRAIKIARDRADFIDLVGDAKAVLQDPCTWENYLFERDLEQPKRSVGRPSLPKHMKKESTKIKRSDLMKKLLLSHGITVKSIGQDEFLTEYPDWEFLPNGRLRYKQESPVSVHKFLRDHDLIS